MSKKNFPRVQYIQNGNDVIDKILNTYKKIDLATGAKQGIRPKDILISSVKPTYQS